MPKSTKAAKPHKDFPLFPHATGRWAKKVRQKLVYFGKVADDPDGQTALARWLEQKDDLLAGRSIRTGEGLTCRDLANGFLEAKERLADAGEISRSHWFDYHRACERMLDCFGKTTAVASLRPDDFDRLRSKIAETWGPVALGNEIQRIRSVFKWGYDSELLKAPIRFGQSFKKPSKKVRRLARKASGEKLFTAHELRIIIAAADTPLKAMILLALNAGFGQTDLSTLPLSRLDLSKGWHTYERPKTGTDRRAPLWPETIKALKEAIAKRPKPKSADDADMVFVTRFGERWVRLKWAQTETGVERNAWIDSIGMTFRKLVRKLGINRPGASFYTLRRTFRTVADEAGDQPAAMFLMGHADDDADMSATYRQRIDDARLTAVTGHVRKWLFPKGRKRK